MNITKYIFYITACKQEKHSFETVTNNYDTYVIVEKRKQANINQRNYQFISDSEQNLWKYDVQCIKYSKK